MKFVYIALLLIAFASCADDTKPRLQLCPSKRPEACTREFNPVCGWFDPEKVNCIRAPCANTYSNPCMACADENVLYISCEKECTADLDTPIFNRKRVDKCSRLPTCPLKEE